MIRLPRPLLARSATRKRAVRREPSAALRWSHLGASYQITLWPECRIARHDGFRWRTVEPTEALLAAAAVALTPAAWTRYLEFVPAEERSFLRQFRFGRLQALRVIVKCPSLLPDLMETPALVSFLAAHASLRGTDGEHWTEIIAVHERAGVFGLLEWLGLPADRPTLSALRNLIDPDVPLRLLAPLRTSLWNPAATNLLCQAQGVSDRQLAQVCHALAA